MRMLRAAAETAGRESAPGEFDGELLAWIAEYASPAGTGRVAAGGSFADTRSVPANNEGVPRPDGWSVWESAAVRYEFAPWLSVQAREVSFFGEDGDDGNRVLDTSIEAGHRYFSAEAGKISTWYGPGRHGALIFTNNAARGGSIRMTAGVMDQSGKARNNARYDSSIAGRPRSVANIGLSTIPSAA